MSESFSTDWLALREPYDAAARSAAQAQRFAALLPQNAVVVDLACGTGANARYQSQHCRAHWRLADHDRALLDVAASWLRSSGQAGETLAVDLRAGCEAALDGAHGVTTAAFADLASRAWIDALFDALAERSLPALIALSVDGRHTLAPADRDDDALLAAFAQDQRRDKGFGPASGPQAPSHLVAAAGRVGYTAIAEASDWIVPASDQAMLAAMIDGIAKAAVRARPRDVELFMQWRLRRTTQIAAGVLSLMVGHQDVLAFPAGSSRA